MRPRIGISVDSAQVLDGQTRGTYRRAVEEAGGEPVLIAATCDIDSVASLVNGCDGLLIPGGKDLAPEEYGARPHPAVRADSPTRDVFELHALRHARCAGIPTLGICRGVQVMNVALGGTLYEDIADQYKPPNGLKIRHDQTPERSRSDATHQVDLTAGSMLSSVLAGVCIATNSMHHQALRRVAFDLMVVGTTRDGIAEAVEARTCDHPFFVGVQWHPEDMVEHDRPSRALFAEFVRCAAARARQRATDAAV
ncbi:MAG: gamma-glutamyl-gamma-aminobutyrate hydrolase family protein [Candidatus Eremiobacteraeota bacterium]|nr:gamma-glutamyl-gamma-aminobutyrate hydrolase family protein [Candidatus Eremiobacteraeota bacterium]MBC5828543.1 gamma-glutamyl-gamma-aminobutyrate hydrolase family protein [Candidatus Eremiobacteraeota bacterium]